ncbi:hypothetical protein PENDEC_c046G00242 [Penicillium decumbens]|uniref:Uncharacterized protein n=1 Tax=Penicillium decumbens TaxID=69771 RepID=A0A1V6NRA8_PENDC|nr:hypothetical protein PENDEC_c046G00242 [Penicillium decumbens]
MASTKASPPCHWGLTPPNSPTNGLDRSQTTVKDLKQLYKVLEKVLLNLANTEIANAPVFQDHSQPGPDVVLLKQLLVKLTDASNEQEENVEIDLKIPICTTPEDFKSFEKWASKSQFKTVLETWDKEACKYKIAEPTESSGVLDDYAEYAFVVRERLDRNSKEVTQYIDIKSEGLRDILREVLHDIKAISLMEDRPSIEQNVLFHFLPELANYAENINNADCEFPRQHLRLLIDYLKQAYLATS